MRDLARRVLVQGLVLAILLAIVAGIIGRLVAGEPGLWSALTGVGFGSVFMLLTAASFWVGERLRRRTGSVGAFFGVVMGTWLLKLVAAVVAFALMSGQSWVVAGIFAWSLIAGVLGSLAVEIVAFLRLLRADKVDQY